jgi:hypothetical protein
MKYLRNNLKNLEGLDWADRLMEFTDENSELDS